MKKLIAKLWLLNVLFLIFCNRNLDTDELVIEITKTDKAMSELAVKEGFLMAVLYYADDNIVKLSDGSSNDSHSFREMA